MTCDDCTPRLDDLDDGRLAPADAAAVRRHLDTCRVCGALAADASRIRAAVRGLGPIEPPARVWTQVAAAVGAAYAILGAVLTPLLPEHNSGRSVE